MAITLNNLGRALKAQGNIEGAHLHLQRALEVAEASFGPVHPEVALQACILADLLSDLGGFREARIHYQRAQKITESLSGRDHLDVAVILSSLGSTAIAQGEPAEARAFFARALKIFREKLGQEHPYTRKTEAHLEMLQQSAPLEVEDDGFDYYYQ